MFPYGIVIEPENRQYRTSKVNQVFSLISSISKDKGDKVKDSSTLNEDESCLVAGAGLTPFSRRTRKVLLHYQNLLASANMFFL